MDTVMIRSGRVDVMLGSNVTDFSSKITGYLGVTSNTTGNTKYKDSPYSTYQAVVSGTGAITATVTIQCSNDGTNWNATALGVITLNGTTTATDGIATVAPWKYVRAVLSNLTGTGAACYVLMGV
jgi:hypothetical protein